MSKHPHAGEDHGHAALVGGFLFTRFGAAGVTGLNLYSILVAIVGAVVVLFIYHALTRGRGAL